MDGLTLRALVLEWQERLIGSRIEKIHQPSERDILLTLRHRHGTERLLLSAHREFARAHLQTGPRPASPAEPPRFCNQLRRHLESGRLVGVEQDGLDRVLLLTVDSLDDLGDLNRYTLVAELMGKHSNLILCKTGTDGRPKEIVDAAVHVPQTVSRVRQVLPGLIFARPPAQNKMSPKNCSASELAPLLSGEWTGKRNQLALMKTVSGLGPTSAREALWRSRDEQSAQKLCHVLSELAHRVDTLQELQPHVGLDSLGRPTEYAPFPLLSAVATRSVESMSFALEAVHMTAYQSSLENGLARELQQVVRTAKDRLRGKLAKIEELETASAEHERLRMYGELLLAYGYSLEKGATEANLPSFEEDGGLVSIPLDPALTAMENAQRFFRQSAKRKRSIAILAAERASSERDLFYLDNVEEHLLSANPEHLESIREELIAEGFHKRPTQRTPKSKNKSSAKSHKKPSLPQPDSYTSRDGFTLLVGRNNYQNDRLTLRMAKPHDIWMHAKDTAGSHVLIRNDNGTEIPATTLEDAALLAAYFSRARDSSQVAVDYTEARHVWKQNGARPGHVLYDHQHTLFITPHREAVFALLNGRASDVSEQPN
ncbi:MAG: NFACT family protein [Alicyclobacillaceae bacterium]|nr:NFACT family protein [Alicyclobacillaceae bacterium]